MDDSIIATIRLLERRYITVYPHQVVMWMDCDYVLSERQIRNRMRQMALNGMLVRVGERGGYLTADRATRHKEAVITDMQRHLSRSKGIHKAAVVAQIRIEDALNGAFFICR